MADGGRGLRGQERTSGQDKCTGGHKPASNEPSHGATRYASRQYHFGAPHDLPVGDLFCLLPASGHSTTEPHVPRGHGRGLNVKERPDPRRSGLGARSTSHASTSTTADFWTSSTDSTRRNRFLLRTNIPSMPSSGPRLIRTQSPHFRNGWGSTCAQPARVWRTASTSTSGMIADTPANPTKPRTPSVARILSRCSSFPRKNQVAGKQWRG